ncbi:MAG: hypothetical protein JWO85_2129 [Candidatus Eremiobacteraeota bacterium]|nr:hypothetical protein [Candidatus Eremiobacteraeota bacterium]
MSDSRKLSFTPQVIDAVAIAIGEQCDAPKAWADINSDDRNFWMAAAVAALLAIPEAALADSGTEPLCVNSAPHAEHDLIGPPPWGVIYARCPGIPASGTKQDEYGRPMVVMSQAQYDAASGAEPTCAYVHFKPGSAMDGKRCGQRESLHGGTMLSHAFVPASGTDNAPSDFDAASCAMAESLFPPTLQADGVSPDYTQAQNFIVGADWARDYLAARASEAPSDFDEWFADAPLPAEVPEPTDLIPYRWAKYGWNAALRSKASVRPTHQQFFAAAFTVIYDTQYAMKIAENCLALLNPEAALAQRAQPEPSNAKAFDEWFGPATGEGRFEYGGGCPIRTAAWLAWLAGGDRMAQQAQPDMPTLTDEVLFRAAEAAYVGAEGQKWHELSPLDRGAWIRSTRCAIESLAIFAPNETNS